ncbi:MAG TPA: AAA family ATPase [Candidatus Paceibacterota bacterium]|nr:AAA family ATPase [Candidatus Paceibacterota bacterium]
MAEKKHIITIAGLPGSGKSSTASGVAKELGYEHFSSGDLFRKMAAERGISIEEMNFTAEKQKEIDKSVDALLRSLGEEKQNMVIDSRIAFHWIPDSFKVFLRLELTIATERMFAQVSAGERMSQHAASARQMLENTLGRIESEKKRFSDLYAVDFTDARNYDLVVDTGANDLAAVITTIVQAYQEWLAR